MATSCRPGHLHGNRFRILVRDLDPAIAVAEVLTPLLERLRSMACPITTARSALATTAKRSISAWRCCGRSSQSSPMGAGLNLRNSFLKKLALSAAQSGLFNHYLGRRWLTAWHARCFQATSWRKFPFGGLFVAEDIGAEQKRFDAREIVTAGPIFGRKTFPACGEAASARASHSRGFRAHQRKLRRFRQARPGNAAAQLDLSEAILAPRQSRMDYGSHLPSQLAAMPRCCCARS